MRRTFFLVHLILFYIFFFFGTKSIEFLLNCTDCNLILAERPAGNEAIDHTEGSRERERERDGEVDGEIEEGKKE